MQNRDIYLMILGMTLVTYLPRVLPAFLMGRIRLSARVEHFLQLIPYTAMTALVFPGVFSVDANPVLGVVGAAVECGCGRGMRKKIRQSARCRATSYCTQFLPSNK